MEVSIREKYQAMEEKLAANEQELTALHAACDDYKTEKEAVKAELMEAKADVEGQAVAHAEALEEIKADLEEKEEALVLAGEANEQMKANMEISPAAKVIEGQDLDVEEGVEAGDKVDHVAEMNKLELGSSDQIAYYRANKEEIDKA